MADPHGPTGGKPARADGKEAKNVAFIQCAGSRDENHLRHCSRICCMASLKQTHYVREACGDEGKSTIYYIDIRAIDRFEDFYQMVQNDPTVSFVKSKVARIAENEQNGNPVLHGVDTEGYHRYATEHDLVVLAVGMEPEVTGVKLPDDIVLDSSNFIEGSKSGGMFGAGAAASPLDVNRSVQSATAASLKAIQVIPQDCFDGGRMNAPATPHPSTPPTSAPAAASATSSKVGALEKIAQKEGKMAVVKSHPFLCNAEGVQMIKDDIANDGVTHVCIAACSRRAKAEAFQLPRSVAVSRANLREGVLWVVAEGKPSTTRCARKWPRTTCAWAAPRSRR
jgi:heterodisulfide reductase subunit A-like polyferredoxin